jgi:hypothetical protein
LLLFLHCLFVVATAVGDGGGVIVIIIIIIIIVVAAAAAVGLALELLQLPCRLV